jgi:hypothetical protein
LNTLGRRFRTALTALVVCALLAAGVTTSEVMAAGDDAQLEQLWDEFPLDERDEHPVRNQPFDRQSPPSKPAPARPTADEASDGSTRLGFLTFGIALLLGATGILLLRAGALGPPSGTSEADSYRNRPQRRLADATTTGSGENRAVHALLYFLAGDEFVAEDAPAAQQSKEVKVPGDLKKPDQRTDAMALKERRPQMRVSRPAPSVDEREVLKRKSAADAEPLKAKAARESALLKEKLVSRQRRQQSVKGGEPAPNVAEQPIRPRRRGDLNKARSLRPARIADTSEPQVGARLRDADKVALECEIHWWRGYVKSQFIVVERGAERRELAASPPFRWRKSEPPPQTPATSAALKSLVESFVRDGWVVAGRGEEWFALRLRRARDTQGGVFGRSASNASK